MILDLLLLLLGLAVVGITLYDLGATTISLSAGLDDVARETGLDRSTTGPLRQAISDYVQTLDIAFIPHDEAAPPPPQVDRVVAAGGERPPSP